MGLSYQSLKHAHIEAENGFETKSNFVLVHNIQLQLHVSLGSWQTNNNRCDTSEVTSNFATSTSAKIAVKKVACAAPCACPGYVAPAIAQRGQKPCGSILKDLPCYCPGMYIDLQLMAGLI